MKTTYELQYESLIFSLIITHEESKERQLQLLMDFHQNAQTYYDALCDAVYDLSVGRKTGALYITESGKPFFSASGSQPDGYAVCYPAEVPEFKEDLIEQLEFVLGQLKMLSKRMDCNWMRENFA